MQWFDAKSLSRLEDWPIGPRETSFDLSPGSIGILLHMRRTILHEPLKWSEHRWHFYSFSARLPGIVYLLWKMTLWQQATDCKASWHGPPVCLSLSWASPEMPDCWPRAEGVKAPSLSAPHCHFWWGILEGGGAVPDCLDTWWHQQW